MIEDGRRTFDCRAHGNSRRLVPPSGQQARLPAPAPWAGGTRCGRALTALFIELPPAADREDAFDLLNGAGELLVNYELNQENGLLAQMQKAIQKRLVEQYGYKSL